jgi:hypothetical protein
MLLTTILFSGYIAMQLSFFKNEKDTLIDKIIFLIYFFDIIITFNTGKIDIKLLID